MSEIPPTRRGYDAFEVVSALQKAIRRSQVQEAVYWAYELNESGMANWLWKRLRVIVSEDIGQAAPGLAADVRALYENWKQDSKGGSLDTVADLYVVHAVIMCAIAPKSRLVDWCLTWNNSDWTERLDVPDEALDPHTRRGKALGRDTSFFMSESTKLIDFDGDLEEMEHDYHERLNKLTDDGGHHPFRGDSDAPNPWPPPRQRSGNGESWIPPGAQQKLEEQR